MAQIKLVGRKVEVPESIQEVHRFFYEKGWSDGLPIIPPTIDAVESILQGTDMKSDEVIGLVPPRLGEATVEKIATNAVMAGCFPEHMPVIIAALRAMLLDEFNLCGIQVTTHPCTPLIIINGPIRNELKVNSGHNLFGQGSLANAVIGRAIRLILVNIGGAIPGQTDKATHGQPGKFTYCIGENEEQNPWMPLHVERGFDPSESTVTVVAAECPHNVNDHAATTSRGLLTTIAGTMATQGNNNIQLQRGEPLIILGPEHAAIMAQDNLSKQDVKYILWERARIPCRRFSKENREHRFHLFGEDDSVPIAKKAEDMMVIVAGGAGKHSLFIPTFGDTKAVTMPIQIKSRINAKQQ